MILKGFKLYNIDCFLHLKFHIFTFEFIHAQLTTMDFEFFNVLVQMTQVLGQILN